MAPPGAFVKICFHVGFAMNSMTASVTRLGSIITVSFLSQNATMEKTAPHKTQKAAPSKGTASRSYYV